MNFCSDPPEDPNPFHLARRVVGASLVNPTTRARAVKGDDDDDGDGDGGAPRRILQGVQAQVLSCPGME